VHLERFNKKNSSKKLQLQQHFTNMYSESKGKGVFSSAKQKDPICQTELHHPVGLSLIAVRDINTSKQMRVRRGKSSALPCPWYLPAIGVRFRFTSDVLLRISSSMLLFLLPTSSFSPPFEEEHPISRFEGLCPQRNNPVISGLFEPPPEADDTDFAFAAQLLPHTLLVLAIATSCAIIVAQTKSSNSLVVPPRLLSLSLSL
jgi:hypothetical protein